MRGSAKGDEPKALISWRKGQWAALVKPRYGDLSGDPQQVTKKAIFAEQTGQCVYCGRGIDLEAHNRHHIEHFRPRSLYPEAQLVYENLFLSCGPQQSQGGLQPTCGNKKEDWFDENCHVEPAPEKDCQQRFVFASDGQIQSDGSPEAAKMIQILNLNYSELVVERSTLIEELDGEIEQGATLSELIKSFCDLSSEGARVSFANVAIQYLRRQVGLV